MVHEPLCSITSGIAKVTHHMTSYCRIKVSCIGYRLYILLRKGILNLQECLFHDGKNQIDYCPPSEWCHVRVSAFVPEVGSLGAQDWLYQIAILLNLCLTVVFAVMNSFFMNSLNIKVKVNHFCVLHLLR